MLIKEYLSYYTRTLEFQGQIDTSLCGRVKSHKTGKFSQQPQKNNKQWTFLWEFNGLKVQQSAGFIVFSTLDCIQTG